VRSVDGRLRVGGGARAVVLRRCDEACEGCGLEWPWALYLFLVDDAGAAAAANLVALCAACSDGRTGAFAPLVTERSLRERMRDANNRRTGAARLTSSRRKRLIAQRGSRCEICGVGAGERQLDVHHRVGLLQGGDDSETNLMVLCFACHHHLQPCAEGCGRWAKKPAAVCSRCRLRHRLEEVYPALSWEEIKARHPSLAEERSPLGKPADEHEHRRHPRLFGALAPAPDAPPDEAPNGQLARACRVGPVLEGQLGGEAVVAFERSEYRIHALALEAAEVALFEVRHRSSILTPRSRGRR
jgi:hypothetical protein